MVPIEVTGPCVENVPSKITVLQKTSQQPRQITRRMSTKEPQPTQWVLLRSIADGSAAATDAIVDDDYEEEDGTERCLATTTVPLRSLRCRCADPWCYIDDDR